MNKMHAYAAMAPTAKMRKQLNQLADDADKYAAELAQMPEWAQGYGHDMRVPVSVKVEHDGLAVETWTAKSGKTCHRVTWQDGSSTQYTGDLAEKYVNWNWGY